MLDHHPRHELRTDHAWPWNVVKLLLLMVFLVGADYCFRNMFQRDLIGVPPRAVTVTVSRKHVVDRGGDERGNHEPLYEAIVELDGEQRRARVPAEVYPGLTPNRRYRMTIREGRNSRWLYVMKAERLD